MRDDKESNNVDNWEIEAQKLDMNEGNVDYSNQEAAYNYTSPNTYDSKGKWATRNDSQGYNNSRYEDKGRAPTNYTQNDKGSDYNKFASNRFSKPYNTNNTDPVYSSQLLLSMANINIDPSKNYFGNTGFYNRQMFHPQQQGYDNSNLDKGNNPGMNVMNRGALYPVVPTGILGYPPMIPPNNPEALFNKTPYFPFAFPPPLVDRGRGPNQYDNSNNFNNNRSNFDNINNNEWRTNNREINQPYKNGFQNSTPNSGGTLASSYQYTGSNINGSIAPMVQPSQSQKYVPPHMNPNSNCYSQYNGNENYYNKPYQNMGFQSSYTKNAQFKPNSYNSVKDSFSYPRNNDRYDSYRNMGNNISGRQENKFVGQDLTTLLNSNQIPVDLKYWIDNSFVPDPETESQIYQGSNTGINFEKYKHIPIETSGKDCPSAVENWAQSKINQVLLPNITRCNYMDMTPVQKYAVAIIMGKRDLMACAQTGSGKTAAFLIPVMNQIMELPSRRPNGNRFPQCPYALVLAPTRELALQIHLESLKFSYGTQMKSCVIYGGTKPYKQLSELKGGCHLLIATPGRLRDMLERKTIALDYCKFLILDEADKMLDMGFEPQIRDIVDNNNMPITGIRQTMMFSATFPKEIQVLARDFLKDYIFLTVGKVGGTTEDITQQVVWVEDNDKKKTLLNILDMEDLDNSLILIFLERKKGVDALESFLLSNGFNACSIHGDHCQEKREASLDAFRSGKVTILLATSVASRGLDIPNVKLVINFDMPNDIDEYVHRIGRTGRVGNIGYSTTFINDKNRNVFKSLHKTLQQTKQEVPDWLKDSVTSLATPYNSKLPSRYNNSYKRGY